MDPMPADDDPHADQKAAFSIDQLQTNLATIDYCRTSLTAIGGLLAGILGCTGFQGVLAFVAVYALVSLALLVRMQFRVSDYMLIKEGKAHTFILEGIFKYGLSYVMCWTLAYCLVYIY